MPEIRQSVGAEGVNSSDDVALVQLMLRLVKNANGQPYFSDDYSGAYTAALKTAITQFQTDQKLIQAPAAPAPLLVRPAAAQKLVLDLLPQWFFEKAGFVGPNSTTLERLLARLPAAYKDIRAIPGAKTVYLAGDHAKAAAMAGQVRAKTQLNAVFREKVAQLVETIYKDHKLVLGIPADGWRRDFAAQAAVNPAATGAGPGESAHQYGRAVDIGFASLKWVAGDGTIKTDSLWLSAQGMAAAKQAEFWAARNQIAYKQIGLFKTNKPGDEIHLQGFDDATVSWGRSLARLLETASPSGSKWSAVIGRPIQYKADLKLGSTFTVGSARAIWAGKAAINKAELAKSLNAKLAIDAKFSVGNFLGAPAKAPQLPVAPAAQPDGAQPAAKTEPPAKTAPPAKPAPLTEADVTEDGVKHLQKLLKAEFEAADRNWDRWAPIK